MLRQWNGTTEQETVGTGTVGTGASGQSCGPFWGWTLWALWTWLARAVSLALTLSGAVNLVNLASCPDLTAVCLPPEGDDSGNSRLWKGREKGKEARQLGCQLGARTR